jgi:ADP-ribose pyrophosphatase YjhB (NUDIX family)
MTKPTETNSERFVQSQFSLRTPEGEDRDRRVCDTCGFIDYVNPKIVVGSVVEFEGRFLLCRRAIHPRKGYWTLPAGFLEENESVELGAAREAWEEACAKIEILGLLSVYSIPRISQVQLMFRATMTEPAFEAGPESLEVALFSWDEIPWNELAFPSVVWALNDYQSHLAGVPGPFSNPSDPGSL